VNAGCAGCATVIGGRGGTVVDPGIKTPLFPFTISTRDRPFRFSVIDFQRLVYGASWLSDVSYDHNR
jgi:hypothetical protein